MSNIDLALQYFIEYESHNRLNNVSMPNDAKCLDNTYIYDTDKLKKHIETKLKSIIKKKLSYDVGKDKKETLDALLEDLLGLRKDLSTISRENIEETIEKYGISLTDKNKYKINEIYELLTDTYLTVLSPIYSLKDKNMHLIGFKCYIDANKLMVEEIRVNSGLLDALMLNKVGYGVDEYVGGMEAAQELFANINKIEFNTYDEALVAIFNILNEKFPIIKDELCKGYKSIAFISLDGLNELYFPPFKEDMKLLSDLENRHDSKLLNKFLLHNTKLSKESSEIELKSHYGSYTDKFAINEKQWKVICGTHQSEILSVSGPPGTGKTTMLKELIADLSVNRTKRIIDVWEDTWNLNRAKSIAVYRSPFLGENYESIIVTSTNNDAVNNIGLEITKDMRELKADLNLRLDSEFSAQLGKKPNRVDFFNNSLTVLISNLENVNYVVDVSSEIKEFQSIIEKIDDVNKCVSRFLKCRCTLEERNLLYYSGEKLSIAKMEEQLENIVKYIKNTELSLNIEQENMLSVIKTKTLETECLSEYVAERRRIEDGIRIKSDQLEIYLKSRSSYLPTKIIKILGMVGNYGNVISNKIYGDVDSLKTEIDNRKGELEAIKDNILSKEAGIEKLDKERTMSSEKIQEINNDLLNCNNKKDLFEEFFYAYKKLIGVLEDDVITDIENIEYKLYNAKFLCGLRYKLFKLSLVINEAYIIKNKEAIINNLNLMMDSDGKTIKSFYRGSYKYEPKIKEKIRDIWETFCICYPVITTTLHSFNKNNFHMIEELFDYMLVDEAGQIMPYYLSAPLYRSRNAIIVGDEKQLEPIRDSNNKVFIKYENELSEHLNANSATAQSLANLATDYYETNSSSGIIEYEGIMLEEHRRCEKSIAQFSNKYVYDGRMIITNEDQVKPFLESNVCFIDIRGVKISGNINQSESKAVAHLVKNLLKIYKEEDIAVIAPYKNQVKAIIKDIENDKVKVGTVHSFQGQDKEIVIMSTTISSEADSAAKRFIGQKPNLLNVAFTRSKKQLFIVGNYSVLENCESSNYLYKAGEFIRNHGTLFSIYDTESLNRLSDMQYSSFIEFMNGLDDKNDNKFNQIFKPFLNSVNILEDKNHYQLLLSLFNSAEKSISVVCPWITKSVIKDDFIENIQSFISSKKNYKIVFGYKASKDSLNTKEEIESIIKRDNQFARGDKLNDELMQLEKLKNVMGANLIYRPPLHSKVLIVDNEYLLMGSHNWLSKQGQRKGDREEMTVIIRDNGMIDYIRQKYGIDKVN